jgi:hypothetical protein
MITIKEYCLMLKNKWYLLLFLILSAPILAQQNYEGKYYVAQISASCKEVTNGGCMIYSYCILKFDKDSVEATYPIIAHCTPSEIEQRYNSKNTNISRKYKWKVDAENLSIIDFDDFKKYSFKEYDEKYVKSLYPNSVKSDSLILHGIIQMENTNEAIPFASIELLKNKINATSDIDGKFILKIKNASQLKFPDTIRINYVGLKPYLSTINSIENLMELFKLPNSFLLVQDVPKIDVQEGPYPSFKIKQPTDGYIKVVTKKDIRRSKRKQKRERNK